MFRENSGQTSYFFYISISSFRMINTKHLQEGCKLHKSIICKFLPNLRTPVFLSTLIHYAT